MKKRIETICFTQRGQSHIQLGVECQDYSLATSCLGNKKSDVLICVADGHGGDAHKNSSLGSKIAAEIILAAVEDIHKMRGGAKRVLNFILSGELAAHIANEWQAAVCQLHKEFFDKKETKQASVIEKYGTTLLFVFTFKKWLIAGQLGDGAIALLCNKDERNNQVHIANVHKQNHQTASLCMSDCEKLFVIRAYKKKQYNFALISTDGVFDSFLNDAGYLEFASELNQALKSNTVERALSTAFAELEKCSGDDMSIALLG